MRLTVEQPPPVCVEYALRMTAPELHELRKELQVLPVHGYPERRALGRLRVVLREHAS